VPDRLPRNLGIGIVLGILLAAAAAAIRETLRTTVLTEQDLRNITELEPVGVVSDEGRARRAAGPLTEYPDGFPAEAFRKLRTAVPASRFATPHADDARAARTGSADARVPILVSVGRVDQRASLLVTSAVPAEGAASVACGLAVAFAEAGYAVVLVDADLREDGRSAGGANPRGVDAYLGITSSVGLSDVLAGTAPLTDALTEWGSERLHVVSAGSIVANPGELLASPALAGVVRALEHDFDLVLVNAPPLLPVADGAVLSTLTTGVLLVVRAGRTRQEEVDRAVRIVKSTGAGFIGAVLNTTPDWIRGAPAWRFSEPPARPRVARDRPEQPADARPETGGPAAKASVARGRARVVPGVNSDEERTGEG
jgi:non-specific protein-tyrosine kinase